MVSVGTSGRGVGGEKNVVETAIRGERRRNLRSRRRPGAPREAARRVSTRANVAMGSESGRGGGVRVLGARGASRGSRGRVPSRA